MRLVRQRTIWGEAEHARSKYWPENTFPIESEIVIQRELDLEIVLKSGISKIALSNAFLSFDRSKVVIDNYAYNCGQYDHKINFDLAHEIGHYLLHEEIYYYKVPLYASFMFIFFMSCRFLWKKLK